MSDPEPAAHRRRVVGNEYIGLRDQAAQHGLSRRRAQIERQTLLVASVELETGVALQPGAYGRGRPPAIGVASTRRLDLDHLRAEIRHHRRGSRPGNKAGAIDHLQAVKDALTHHPTNRYASPSRTTWPAVRPAKCVPITRIGASARWVNDQHRVPAAVVDMEVSTSRCRLSRADGLPPSGRSGNSSAACSAPRWPGSTICFHARTRIVRSAKYYGFFLSNVAPALADRGVPASLPVMGIILPVGGSFYTFHAISYVIDVYRGKVEPEPSFLKIALYISFFPQLIAGPIVRASFIMPQIRRQRPFSPSQQAIGVRLLLRGFIYKAVIADTLAQIAD